MSFSSILKRSLVHTEKKRTEGGRKKTLLLVIYLEYWPGFVVALLSVGLAINSYIHRLLIKQGFSFVLLSLNTHAPGQTHSNSASAKLRFEHFYQNYLPHGTHIDTVVVYSVIL